MGLELGGVRVSLVVCERVLPLRDRVSVFWRTSKAASASSRSLMDVAMRSQPRRQEQVQVLRCESALLLSLELGRVNVGR